ncbi:hypothetical protein TNIN_434411 [Trichonephila inaurata madagascariensis]|uniref:Uncharacterized protein n=1 Tax=Trichonephila inaurata madagascariensis TaxID=2747483 RepID=A0A8X6YAY9_9ARAC|nr:hypothetical protein TNIN_434411 [Trichonephila inaurata madagascariensis]
MSVCAILFGYVRASTKEGESCICFLHDASSVGLAEKNMSKHVDAKRSKESKEPNESSSPSQTHDHRFADTNSRNQYVRASRSSHSIFQ